MMTVGKLNRIAGAARRVGVWWGILFLIAAPGVFGAAGGGTFLERPLNTVMIWNEEPASATGWLHTAFRREVELPAAPRSARLRLFAYTRYQLFVNGEYVGRGPNRYENPRPEFDEWDLGGRLHPGRNSVAVLVHRDWPGLSNAYPDSISRIQRHPPGFAARLAITLDADRAVEVVTDATWRTSVETSYDEPSGRHYSSIPENRDLRRGLGDWTAADFDSHAWRPAVAVDTADAIVWPEIRPRTIPLLREADVPFSLAPDPAPGADGFHLLATGDELRLQTRQIVQAYPVIEIDTDDFAELVLTPLLPGPTAGSPSRYRCAAGRHRWMLGDTFALNALTIRVTAGRARLKVARLTEVLYPFDRVGQFHTSDPRLDRIWLMTARSLALLSEDAYVDCADRERSEWMDCDPPCYDATRVMMAGPPVDGRPTWSDPRLFANLLRRVAASQEPDGMLRARTCSDVVDIHTRMEDRACDWVEGLRKYHEATGDGALVRELWPALTRLLAWFEQRRQPDGLVRAREWIAWDNPLRYLTCEGAANNAFFYRAFVDAAYLAGQIGASGDEQRWTRVAGEISAAFNRLLWDEKEGAYAASFGALTLEPGDDLFRKTVDVPVVNGRSAPTLHANLFALDRGLVPPERRERVGRWTLAHAGEIRQIMAQHFFFKFLYALDAPEHDQAVLDRIRGGWTRMLDDPWGTTWEMAAAGGGSRCHIYGVVPGHTLPTYVLGVRRDEPAARGRLVIQPHLADLDFAEGVVVTEFGPVPVEWRRAAGGATRFSVEIPPGVRATVFLPAGPRGVITGDDRIAPARAEGRWLKVELPAGSYRGTSE